MIYVRIEVRTIENSIKRFPDKIISISNFTENSKEIMFLEEDFVHVKYCGKELTKMENLWKNC